MKVWTYTIVSVAFQIVWHSNKTMEFYSEAGGLGCSKAYSLICGLQITSAFLLSLSSFLTPHCSLTAQPAGDWIKGEKTKWGRV